MKFGQVDTGMGRVGGNNDFLCAAAKPRIHLTESSRENPMAAPLFCMVMRKHIAGGKIIDIVQISPAMTGLMPV